MSEKTIYTAINGIMEEIGAIEKTKRNSSQGQGFMYRGVDDVMNSLQPLLIKHGVFCTPEVLEHTREERQAKSGSSLIYSILKIKYTFYAGDGSSVNTTIIGEGMDSGDKASNKALSIAFKYACFQLFCIPTEEMKDPDADTPPDSTSGNANKTENEITDGELAPDNQPPEAPPNPTPKTTLTEKQIKRLYAISKSANVNDETLKKLLMKHYKKDSPHDLTRNEYDFICNNLQELADKLIA